MKLDASIFKKMGGVEVCTGVRDWDKFWNEVEAGGLKILFLKPEEEAVVNLTRIVEVQPGRNAKVILRILDCKKLDLSLDFKVPTNSHLEMSIECALGGDSCLGINVQSIQGNFSTVACKGRFICIDNAELQVRGLGNVGEKIKGAECSYDFKVLQVGTGGRVTVYPQLKVGTVNADVKHGFAVDRIPEDVVVYLGSRGVGREDAEIIYAKGFLAD